MPYQDKYTKIDGQWHHILGDERTDCLLVIPQANGYVTELPEKVHCRPTELTAENPASVPDDKAKKAK